MSSIFGTREFQEFAADYDLLKIEGFDDCAVCVTCHNWKPQIVYSAAMILNNLMGDHDMDGIEALEYFEYNIVGGLPNNTFAPIILLDY